MTHYLFSANLWFTAGLVLCFGLGPSTKSFSYEAFYGYGAINSLPAYGGVFALFLAAAWNLIQWQRTRTGPPNSAVFFAGANVWFVAGLILCLGLGPSANSHSYEAIYGYGKINSLSAYGGVLAVFAAAVWYFVHWRRTRTDVPTPQPVPVAFPPAGRRRTWSPLVLACVILPGVLLLMFVQTGVQTQEPATPVATEVWRPPAGDRPLVVRPLPAVPVADGPRRFIAMTFVFFSFVWLAVVLVRANRVRPPFLPPITAPTPSPPSAVVPPAVRDHPRTCPKCHAAIAADAPQGLCPRCLMAGAFQSILNPSRTGPYGGPVEPPTPEEVQEHFPNLEVLGILGQGGMGAVYQARQPNLDRTVALKLIRPRDDNPMFAERFVREAKAMAKLSHPNIVHIHESGEAGGSLFLIMEFVDGVTLREAIRAKAIPPAEALKIVGQLCDALEYAHGQGVVHRDIKPENILLDRTGRVKVVDFGLAKLANDNAVSLTHTRQAMGTPHYMAPEQWEKPTEVDHRADIYAMGVVIYELLTGELPLGRFDPPSVKAHLDSRIDEIVLRLLAKEPDRRYQHASDVRTALFNMANVAPARGPAARRGFYEYRSETEYLGWPLVHVVRGIDPRTGTKRIAKGWIAVGDVMAIGVLAVSGVFSLGLFAVAGVLGLGGLALAGAFAVGGGAVGGNALGFFAVGGVAIGWLAVGGVAVGKFAYGERVHRKRFDPEFWKELREGLSDLFDFS